MKQNDLRSLFIYEDGHLYRRFGKTKTGTIKPSGYVIISIDKKFHMEHTLIYCYHTGYYGQVDHIDRDKTNNRIENLRPADKQRNEANTPARKTSKTGYKGVCWHKQNSIWRAQISIGKSQISLGCYIDINDAIKAYNETALEWYGNFAYLNEAK